MKKIIIGTEGRGKYANRILNYILKLKYPDIEIEYRNDDSCQLILRSVFLRAEGKWNKKSKPYIYWSGERRCPKISPLHTDCVALLTVKSKKPVEGFRYCPYITSSPYLVEEGKIRRYVSDNGHGVKDRPLKVAYCCSNSKPRREELFNKFAEKDERCFALGKCCGKFPDRRRKISGTWKSRGLIEAYSKYQFVIAMENEKADGYITEKIMNAYAAGSVPIYYGDRVVGEFFNKESYIDVSDFDSLDACVDHVLSMSDDDISKMMTAPIYNTDSSVDEMNIVKIFTDKNPYYLEIADKIFSMCKS